MVTALFLGTDHTCSETTCKLILTSPNKIPAKHEESKVLRRKVVPLRLVNLVDCVTYCYEAGNKDNTWGLKYSSIRSSKVFCYRILGLSFTSIGLFVRSWGPSTLNRLLLYKIYSLFPLVVHALEVVFEVEWRATYFSSLRAKLIAPLDTPNWVWPSMTNIGCSSFEPPHYLKHAPKTYKHGRFCMEKQPTPDQKLFEVRG